ncbi:MAG: YbjN domain-containing protein [Calothrix sp. MO_167.B12]|nr:YbjN domain-containing protein [Calothrix sp. MO_167.B12]
MVLQTDTSSLDRDLTFYDASTSPVTLCKPNLLLIRDDNAIIGCRLCCQVSFEEYQKIDAGAIFNLKSALRGSLIGGKFIPDVSVHMKFSLKPDILPNLLEHGENAEAVVAYLLALSQKTEPLIHPSASFVTSTGEDVEVEQSPDSAPPDLTQNEVDPLLQTESWLCLSVKQVQASNEVGYKTFWSYINPANLYQTVAGGEQILSGVAGFLEKWIEGNWSKAAEKIANEIIEDFGHSLEALVDESSSELDDSAGHEITDHDTNEPSSLFDIVTAFFAAEDWPVYQREGTTNLQLAFQGNNGQWSCYVHANETRQEFLFYSLCPVTVPVDKRLVMAEFLTRANYGLTIGNFEMYFDSGEIHYKTSLDVEGDRLSIALVRQLVYANVMIMDQYLPGIMAIIYGNVSPIDAIAQIEN